MMADGEVTDSPPALSSRLLETVVKGGYCVGCGTCASLSGGQWRMELDANGRFTVNASTAGTACEVALPLDRVCPFSAESIDEDRLSASLFASAPRQTAGLGRFRSTWMGHVDEAALRQSASSGGIVTWLLGQLLESGAVDGVIHVVPTHPTDADSRIYHFAISESADEVRRGSRSHYYPVEISQVVKEVRGRPGRFAFVGVPCFVKAMRLLAREDPVIRSRVRYCIGLFCGHLKSTRFADLFAWQCGIPPGSLERFEFRVKIEDQPANRYGIRAVGRSPENHLLDITRGANELKGRDWGMGFFRYPACDYCDDVVGETADISVGDAWLPECIPDWRGMSVVVVRNRALEELIEEGISSAQLVLEPVSPERVYESQAANFRHRSDGLRYRLLLKDRQGKWRPPKRVNPCEIHLDAPRRRLYELRMLISAASDSAFRNAVSTGDVATFVDRMAALEREYQACYEQTRPSPPPFRRLTIGARTFLGRMVRLVLGNSYDEIRGWFR